MQSSTQRFLRGAVQEALNAEDDAAAIELMAILSGRVHPQPVAALPSHQSTTPGPAHDRHFWAQFIHENFIPFISNNGRSRFTSPELFRWVENYADFPFTDGDIEQRSGGAPVFRKRISEGLDLLKQRGVVFSKPGSREYEILPTPATLC